MEADLKMRVREAELNMLKAQINPHFLFNALNSISLLTTRDPERAREMIIKLSDYLRYSLRYGEDSMITFREELDNMERYMDIEKIRFGKKLIYIKNISEKSLDKMVPNMILQPVLENAIKHGVYESIQPKHISIKSGVQDSELIIVIENEFDPENIPAKGAGIGLRNVTSRLQLLFNRSDLLNFRNYNGIFTVNITIPVK